MLHPFRGQRRDPAPLVRDPGTQLVLPLLLVLADDPLDVLPRDLEVALALVELLINLGLDAKSVPSRLIL
jgi:hypothetical protein